MISYPLALDVNAESVRLPTVDSTRHIFHCSLHGLLRDAEKATDVDRRSLNLHSCCFPVASY